MESAREYLLPWCSVVSGCSVTCTTSLLTVLYVCVRVTDNLIVFVGKEGLMFQIASYEKYSDGQVIFKEGTHGDWLYIVEDGCVEISRIVNNNKILIATFKEGEIFGEVAYIAKVERSATATALGNTTIGVIDREFFDQEFNKLSGNFQLILKTLALRLKKTTDVLVALQK